MNTKELVLRAAGFLLALVSASFWTWLAARSIKAGVTGASGIRVVRADTPVRFWIQVGVRIAGAWVVSAVLVWAALFSGGAGR